MFYVEERVSMAAERRREMNAEGAAFTDRTKCHIHTPSTEVKKCYRSDIIPEIAVKFTQLTTTAGHNAKPLSTKC